MGSGEMKSIIQSEKKCYLTGRTDNLHEHHVFFGKNRKLSEKYGLKIWLVGELHNLGDYGVHGKYGHDLDQKIKREVQIKAMEYYGWSVEDFIGIFGRNYI
jgi:hypothetical protein